jgi:hypothetical protein
MKHNLCLIDLPARLAIALLAFTFSVIAQPIGKPADLNGLWVQSNSANPGEFVALALLTQGSAICGNLSTSANGGSIQESSYVVGRAFGGTATFEFASKSGDRTVRLSARVAGREGKLDFEVDGSTGPNAPSTSDYAWPNVTLSRQIWMRNSLRSIAGWCSEQWPLIKQGRFNDIVLQP